MVTTRTNETSMRRVLVVGCAGAGKSTFARRLGAKLTLPVIHLDFHFWRPGWQAPESEAWRAQIIALASASDWIMDGNYINTFDIRMPRADSLIWLDHPRRTCMHRVLMRTIAGYGRTRPDLPAECPEHFDLEFLSYVWNFARDQRPRIVAGIEQFGHHLRITRLGGDDAVEKFFATGKGC